MPGQNDEFEITTSVQVSPLESVTIGHDNSSPGPGWFLDKVYKILWRYIILYMYTISCIVGACNTMHSLI